MTKTNVLLISLDTTRADHLGCYGWRRNTSPHLDRLAEEGSVFEHCFSPWIPTHPAHTTMLTGCDVMKHQVVAQGAKTELGPGVRTLAELLRARGYWTGAADNLGRWFSRGFDLYQGYQWAQDPDGGWRKGEAVSRSAIEVLNAAVAQEKPFFLFVHYWDAHTPYLPPAPFHRIFYGGDERDPVNRSMEPVLSFPPFMWYFRQWMGGVTDIEFPKAQYDAEIAYMDLCLRHLFQRLDELGLAESTLVIVTADHGEELDEHEMWFDHHGLYDTNLRVPLILRMPGTVPAGKRFPGQVRLVDIVPSVLDLLGLPEVAVEEGMQGRSFLSAFSGSLPEGTAERLFLTECTWMRKRGVRTPDWKLIVARDHPDIHGRPPVELYDLRADPGEQRNLAEERPETVRELRAGLDGWLEARQRETGLPDPIEQQEITLRRIGTPPEEGEGREVRSERTHRMKNSRTPASGPRRKRRHLLLAASLTGVPLGAAAYFIAPAVLSQQAQEAEPPAPPAPPEPQPLAPTALYEGTQDAAVLMYHDVTDKPSVYFDVSTAEFRRQLTQLQKTGANVIPLSDLYEHMRNGKELPPRTVALTFDDGYLGQYENAYPLLKKFGYPATFFITTSTVGVKTGKDHVTWEQLQELEEGGLVTIECHTVTHPDDLRKCDDAQLERELTESKSVLEAKLSKKVRFLAYPVGNANARVAEVAHKAGYEMAFTMGPGWAKSPADALFVPRFLPRYLPEIGRHLKEPPPVDIRPQVIDLAPTGLDSGYEEDGQVRMRWIRGGRLSSARMVGRREVPAILRVGGATAGLNGTFFSDARINSAGSGIVGPILSRFGPGFAPGLPGDRERIAGRPFVLISPEKMAFLPFQPHLGLDAEGIERLLPGATDAFVAGAWLIHRGRPLTHDELESFRLSNVFDFRPRAFFGVDDEGRPFLGASRTGNQSDRLALTLAKLGLKECVLLDSGFSTSLVLGGEVLISGIYRKDMAARPVPHVLLLYPVNPETGEEVVAVPQQKAGEPGSGDVPSPERLQAELSTLVMTGLELDQAKAQPTKRRRGRARRRRR